MLFRSDEARALAEEVVTELGWTQPWFLVSALSRDGTWPIMLEIQSFFDHLREVQLEADAETAAAVASAGKVDDAG